MTDQELPDPVEGGSFGWVAPGGERADEGTWRRGHTGRDGLLGWSAFCYTPERRHAVAATVLDVDQAEMRTLEVTCTGPFALWVGDELVATGTDFTYMEGAVHRVPVRLRDVLLAEGVDDSALEVDPDLPTGLYAKDPAATGTAVRYYRRGSAATRMSTVPASAFVDVDHVHLSGITVALSADCDALVAELLDTPGLDTSFDVNHRPALWPAAQAGPRLLDLARRARTVFVGLDEAARLWHVTTAVDVRHLLPGVIELVVKDGGTAATAFTAEGTTVEPALPVQVVEPVGAGDAFAAGYLASRRRGETVGAALRRGHELAAQVLTSHSDHGTPPRGGAARGLSA